MGLMQRRPAASATFLRARVFDRLPFGQVCYLNGNAPTWQAECSRYAGLLAQKPIDIVFMGIGENGHITVTTTRLWRNSTISGQAVRFSASPRTKCAATSRYIDGCFADIGQVPTHAFDTYSTLTGWRKASSVHRSRAHQSKSVRRDTLEGSVSTACLISILRTCPGTERYLSARERPAVLDRRYKIMNLFFIPQPQRASV